MEIRPTDLQELIEAKQLLENPGLAAKLTNALGFPIEKGFELLPEKWAEKVHEAVHISLNKALRVAVATLGQKRKARSFERLHMAAAVGSGGVGGAFGLAALPIELPISTTIMLRSIADISLSEGEDLSDPETQLACLEVFALGGRSEGDDSVETGYYAVRAALAKAVAEAVEHVAKRGVAAEGAPALVRFIAAIAARFGVVVSEKAAAMAIPALGAVGGGVINGLFIRHFQNMARGHFKLRKLERKYGREAVEAAYRTIESTERITSGNDPAGAAPPSRINIE